MDANSRDSRPFVGHLANSFTQDLTQQREQELSVNLGAWPLGWPRCKKCKMFRRPLSYVWGTGYVCDDCKT